MSGGMALLESVRFLGRKEAADSCKMLPRLGGPASGFFSPIQER